MIAEQELIGRVSSMEAHMLDLKEGVKALNDGMQHLIRIEERQQADRDSIKRAFTAIEELERRTSTLETNLALVEQSTGKTGGWVEKGVFAVVGAAMMFVAKKVGLML